MALDSGTPPHKFARGQKVRLYPDAGQFKAKRGESFLVVGILPGTADALRYQIKSLVDGHVRMVREDQLAEL